MAEHLIQPGKPLSNFGVAARHRDAAGDRAGALALYHRWALTLRDQYAYVACVQIAQEGLEAFPPGKSEPELIAAAKLWISSHDGLTPLGNLDEANVALEKSLGFLAGCSEAESRFLQACIRVLKGRSLAAAHLTLEAQSELDHALTLFTEGNRSRERALTLGDIARLRALSGDVSGALELHEERLRILEQLGDVRERAVTLGDIAELRTQSGDISGVLELHEERPRIFEQLGDIGERALTLGFIARFRALSGEMEEARRLQSERLKTDQQIGELDRIANTLYDLARLDFLESKYDEALPRLAESWDLNNRIGRADGIAFVGQLYGVLLAAAGHPQARAVLQSSREAFQRLGMDSEVSEIDAMIQRLSEEERPAQPTSEEAG